MRILSLTYAVALFVLCSAGGPVWSADTDAASVQSTNSETTILQTLERFLRASYARDAKEAYTFLSKADRAVKTREEYIAENGSYAGFALELSRRLATLIELSDVNISINGRRATVKFAAILPDANHSSLSGIVEGFNADRLERLETDNRIARLQNLDRIADDGELAVIESSDEQWELIHEDGKWRVFVNWADAIEVAFGSVVSERLGWEFYPTRDYVLAQPGQTIQMSYIAVNTGAATTTGKARHTIGSTNVAEHLEIVACFCFLEQSLDAGELVELPLVFRVDYEVPESVKEFTVDYEFFHESEFPEDEVI